MVAIFVANAWQICNYHQARQMHRLTVICFCCWSLYPQRRSLGRPNSVPHGLSIFNGSLPQRIHRHILPSQIHLIHTKNKKEKERDREGALRNFLTLKRHIKNRCKFFVTREDHELDKPDTATSRRLVQLELLELLAAVSVRHLDFNN